MDHRMTFRFLVVAGLALAVSACGGFRENLGLNKQSPDEFRVVSRAPLTVPPDFKLRPPEMGNSQAAQQTASAQPRTLGEQALLEAAGAPQAEPNIRQIVNRETKQINEESDYFVDRLVFWNDITPPGTVVDPVGERRRLQENAALGQPVTTGPTPQIIRRRKAPLEGIF